MAKTHHYLVAPLLALVWLGVSSPAKGQVDVSPPRPNVLLLVDSSGSMEYMIPDSATPTTTRFPKCDPTGSGTNERSRWLNLVEVLTGTIPNFRCQEIKRNGSPFHTAYKLSGTTDTPNPPDYLYAVPYHRPLNCPSSGTCCAPTPGVLPTDPVRFCRYDDVPPACTNCETTTTFPNVDGGLLDAFKAEIRFGLMTFDTSTDPSTTMKGTWSYVWGSSAKGAPFGCTKAPTDQEVGARNAAAPMWEGQMVAFGKPVLDDEVSLLATKNDQIQRILLSTRPFGPTPIAGMMHDAQNYFWNDPNPDGSGDPGPKLDPYSNEGCRDNFIIVLTDGEPNMDLRPYCEGQSGTSLCGATKDACCPFDKPEDIAKALATSSTHPIVKTYVIGFAVSTATTDAGEVVQCNKLTKADLETGICASTTLKGPLKICCGLNRIAYNGGTTNAYFASTAEDLRTALATVLNEASKGTTSRTFPVFSSTTGTTSAGSVTYRFFTSFTPKIQGVGLWQGVVERQRYECDGTTSRPTEQDIVADLGDEFVANVNSSSTNTSPSNMRNFYTAIGTSRTVSSQTIIDSTNTIRTQPSLASRDGAGDYTGSQVSGTVTTFTAKVPAAAMDLSQSDCLKQTPTPTLDKCRNYYLDWLIGGDNGTTNQRCKTAGSTTCNLVADVYHSVPAVIGNPRESLRDEGYQLFATGKASKRPLVLYTSTNDGFLHAFKVASNDLVTDTSDESRVKIKANNELWAFIPPAVLPRVRSLYPNSHDLLLDGAPVVRDVAGMKPPSGANIKLERDLKTIATTDTDWRTVLVQSFGAAYPGYFALDVTDPVAGPTFLWQLTTDQDGKPLFGSGGSTPTIATLYFDPDGGGAREISVALLPGGVGKVSSTDRGDCARAETDLSRFDADTRPRTTIQCYSDDSAKLARSLTIVRLDTGEIIRSFRRSTADAPSSIKKRIDYDSNTNLANLDSPITGQPVAYPGWTGAIADRAYVGDRDGTLWRLDLSSTKPENWTMQLFFDAYHGTGMTGTSGQPIATTPVVSTDDKGQVVVLFSTGSQDDLLGTSTSANFVYSLHEEATTVYSSSVSAKVNWYLQFSGGTRVAGPMTLFSSNVYFSTYTPPTGSSACDSGASRIWGMNFVTPQDSDPSHGGKAALPKDGDPTSTNLVQYLEPDGTLIPKYSTVFGIGLSQVQGCYTTGEAISDPVFGGTYNPITSSASPTFELVVQTGKGKGSSSSSGATNTATIQLPRPDVTPRVNSWALVME
jgi:type IV pilus assembly protein PilY1